MLKALSLTRGGLTRTWIVKCTSERVGTRERERTLGAFVSPLNVHSLTSGGLSTQVQLACSMNGSLIIFTTNCLVALIFAGVSFGTSPA